MYVYAGKTLALHDEAKLALNSQNRLERGYKSSVLGTIQPAN